MNKRTLIVAKKGNRCCDECARGGIDGYYSTWRVTFEDEIGGSIKKVKLVGFNLTKDEINPKFFDNYDYVRKEIGLI